jgi:hypothetical protein
VTSFGLNQITLQPGERGRISVIERGELVRVAPELRRQLVNRGPDPLVLLAVGGAGEHAGRDGEAFASWDDEAGAPPQEVPLPEDLPAEERA